MKLNDNFSKTTRDWVIRIIVGCLLLQLFLTVPLWWSNERSFPTVPFFSVVPALKSYWATFLLPSSFVISLLFVLFLPKNRIGLSVVLGLAFLLILFDVNRLQVWLYQWISMLLVLLFLQDKGKWHSLLQFMLIALYCWSGFNKLNLYYIEHSFPWLMEAFSVTKSLAGFSSLAVSTALIELGIGIGLCFTKTRKVSMYLAILMHLTVLLILGPLGHNWNHPVWPWNVAMIFLVWLLFCNESFIGIPALWKRANLAKIMILLWGFMPLGNVFEIWDEQLSFKMYSGTNPEGILVDSAIDPICFPDSLKVYYNRTLKAGQHEFREEQILIDEWALQEMKVPAYLSERSLKQIGREWCSCLEDPETGRLEVLRVYRWTRAERPNLSYNCSDLIAD